MLYRWLVNTWIHVNRHMINICYPDILRPHFHDIFCGYLWRINILIVTIRPKIVHHHNLVTVRFTDHIQLPGRTLWEVNLYSFWTTEECYCITSLFGFHLHLPDRVPPGQSTVIWREDIQFNNKTKQSVWMGSSTLAKWQFVLLKQCISVSPPLGNGLLRTLALIYLPCPSNRRY